MGLATSKTRLRCYHDDMTTKNIVSGVSLVPSRRFWIVGLVLYAAFIVLLVVLADLGRLPLFFFFPAYDTVGHFVLIGLLAFFINGALNGRVAFRVVGLPVYTAVLVTAVLALAEELSQGFLLTRTMSLRDSLADLAGILVFGFLSARLLAIKNGKQVNADGR